MILFICRRNDLASLFVCVCVCWPRSSVLLHLIDQLQLIDKLENPSGELVFPFFIASVDQACRQREMGNCQREIENGQTETERERKWPESNVRSIATGKRLWTTWIHHKSQIRRNRLHSNEIIKTQEILYNRPCALCTRPLNCSA